MPDRSNHRRTVIAGTIAIALVLLGCGGGSSSGSPAAVPSGVIAVEATEYTFTPATITVFTRKVSFSVRNTGSEAHAFEIFRSDDLENRIDGLASIPAGQTLPLSLELQPGSYAFLCKLNGHDVIGMKGTLTVQ